MSMDSNLWSWNQSLGCNSHMVVYLQLSYSWADFSVRSRPYFVQEMVSLLAKMDSHKALLESVGSQKRPKKQAQQDV